MFWDGVWRDCLAATAVVVSAMFKFRVKLELLSVHGYPECIPLKYYLALITFLRSFCSSTAPSITLAFIHSSNLNEHFYHYQIHF